MEGKNVIMTTLLLSLVLAQIQVEAVICCPDYPAGIAYLKCIEQGGSMEHCASISGCRIVPGDDGDDCGWNNKYILKNPGDDVVNEYCKLGCASSMCGAITTIQNSDASEVVNGAIEKCTKTCSALCTKGSITAVQIA